MNNLQALDIYSGDDKTFSFVARDASRAVKNLTGATLTLLASVDNALGASIQKAGVISDAPNGAFSVSFDAADTAGIGGRFLYKVVADIAGDRSTVVTGILSIRDGVAA